MRRSAAITLSLGLSLMLAGVASVAFGQKCPLDNPNVTYAASPLTYPLASDQYAVQYKLGGGDWTPAHVYISYYGGTNASPSNSSSGYVPGTSMSFVSVPARASTGVQIRVTRLNSGFHASDHVSVRPSAKLIDVSTAGDGTVNLSTLTEHDFAGDQFLLWWGDDTVGGRVEALCFFLDPPYDPPTGSNVKTITAATDLQNLNKFDTLVFQGSFALGGIGDQAYTVPNGIRIIFLAPGAWVQGKLRFKQAGDGNLRRIYGPGVLDGSRFRYDLRACDDKSGQPEQGYHALSWEDPPNNKPGDTFVLDGIVITDHNHATADLLVNGVVNNVKSIGWNGLNGGFRLGDNTKVSNVFLRSGDDSLMMWGDSVTVTNATVWQNYNGAVVNLGWSDSSPGNDCLIDGLYVVKTDWHSPANSSWTAAKLDGQNDAVFASLMVPGTKFGDVHPSLFRNIVVEDAPRTLFSLKILFPECDDPSGPREGNCKAVDLTASSRLNLTIDNLFTPASIVENSIGFQTVAPGFTYEYPAGVSHTLSTAYTFTGSMNIVLTNVIVQSPDGTVTPLTSANVSTVGEVTTNGSNVHLEYPFSPLLPIHPRPRVARFVKFS